MARLCRFELDEGGAVIVEVDDADAEGEQRAGQGDVVTSARQKFESALDVLRPVSNALLRRLQAIAQAPNEVSVEFGIKLSGEAGVIIAKTAAEANIQITLTWKSEPTDRGSE